MGDVEFPQTVDYVDKNGNATYIKDDSFYVSMDDGRSVRVSFLFFVSFISVLLIEFGFYSHSKSPLKVMTLLYVNAIIFESQ